MITREHEKVHQEMALAYLNKAAVVVRDDEKDRIAVSDFGLGDPMRTGLQTLTYFNTDRISAKEIVLAPRQTCPEHWHPVIGEEGEPTPNPRATPPPGREQYYTVWKETVMRPGDQVCLRPGVVHWFQAGDEGAVISDYSTCSRDEQDRFTDPDTVRATVVVD